VGLVESSEPLPRVRVLTLNRPEKRNALSWALMHDLVDRLRELHYDDSIDVVVITGAGAAFCAGADMQEQFSGSRVEGVLDIGRADTWSLLETLPQVVIAAVNGAAVTGGFLLAYSTDLIVADEGAVFQDTHAKWGFLPTGGEAARLLTRLGPHRTRQLMLRSRPLTAAEAHAWGLVAELAPPGEALACALKIAAELLEQDAASLRAIKRMVNGGLRQAMGPVLMHEELENRVGTRNWHRSDESTRRVDDFLGA